VVKAVAGSTARETDGEASGQPTDPKRVVADGYDRIAERYFAWSDARPSPVRLAWLDRADRRIPAGTDVLDLGCGAGVPMTEALARGRRVTGVDLSARQVELARRNVPEATFLQADMTALDLPPASLDAVTAFYSLTHLPQAELPGLLAATPRWLRPGGVLIASLGAEESPDEVEEDWLGVPMFFGHHGAKRNRALLRSAGFELEMAVVESEPEDRHDALFLWVVARKPAAAGAEA
jgi:SAM-dependent methyltransferase